MTYNKGKGPGIQWLKAHLEYDGAECLIWPFSRNHQGYGQAGYNGKIKKAHHLMCQLVHGDRPTPSIMRRIHVAMGIWLACTRYTSLGKHPKRTASSPMNMEPVTVAKAARGCRQSSCL